MQDLDQLESGVSLHPDDMQKNVESLEEYFKNGVWRQNDNEMRSADVKRCHQIIPRNLWFLGRKLKSNQTQVARCSMHLGVN